MSSRLYRMYQRGNPQLRVYLSNFWMKIVRSDVENPPNVVTFSASPEMTSIDARNYLSLIYKIPIVHIRTRIAMGETYLVPVGKYVAKKDDVKLFYVVLPKNEYFKYPEMLDEENEDEKSEYDRVIETQKNSHRAFLDRNQSKPGVPGWFNF